MALKIVIAPAALADLKEAADWYNLQQPNLGDRFLLYVDNKFAQLTTTPGIGSIQFDTVRCTMVDVFSYLIYYTVDKNNLLLTVIRILHTSRKPLWK